MFLSHPERDRRSEQLHNTVFVIAANGMLLGEHRKINTLRVGAESWSSPGDQVAPVPAEPFRRVGILICADAYSPGIAGSLKAQGAQLLVSSAAWPPGFHGPNGEWEQCTRDTGLPLLVCNRTGADRTLDFTEAESVIVKDGQRLLAFRSDRSAIFTIDWDRQTQTWQHRNIREHISEHRHARPTQSVPHHTSLHFLLQPESVILALDADASMNV